MHMADALVSPAVGGVMLAVSAGAVVYAATKIKKDELDEKKVNFVSQKEKFDTSGPNGRFMLTVFAAMAQLERENMLARQKEGIAIAKAEGKYQGRQYVKVDEEKFRQLYNDWQNGKTTPTIMMNELGLKPATFWRRVREYRKKYGITDAATTRKYANKEEK